MYVFRLSFGTRVVLDFTWGKHCGNCAVRYGRRSELGVTGKSTKAKSIQESKYNIRVKIWRWSKAPTHRKRTSCPKCEALRQLETSKFSQHVRKEENWKIGVPEELHHRPGSLFPRSLWEGRKKCGESVQSTDWTIPLVLVSQGIHVGLFYERTTFQ